MPLGYSIQVKTIEDKKTLFYLNKVKNVKKLDNLLNSKDTVVVQSGFYPTIFETSLDELFSYLKIWVPDRELETDFDLKQRVLVEIWDLS